MGTRTLASFCIAAAAFGAAAATAPTAMDDAAAFRPTPKKYIATGHQFGLETTLSNLLENVSAFDENTRSGDFGNVRQWSAVT